MSFEKTAADAEIGLQDLQSKKFLKYKDAEALSNLSSDLADLESKNPEVKKLMEIATSKLLFYKYLSQDQTEWPTDDTADDSWSKTSEELKESVEEEKERIKNLAEEADTSYEKLQRSIQNLESKVALMNEKLKTLTNLKVKQEEIWSKLTEKPPSGVSLQQLREKKEEKLKSIEMCCQNCNDKIVTLKNELSSLQQTAANLQDRARKHRINTSSNQDNISKHIQNYYKRLQRLNADHMQLSGIKVHPAGDDQLVIEFTNNGCHPDDPQLILTINFVEDSLGHVWIKSAQVNIDSFEVEDIIQTGIEYDDIQWMVQKLKQRWFTHFPLASEMKTVAEHHAVDWMQEEGLLRVLVGKGGCIICTLQMPKTYPSSGDITLVNAQGLPDGMHKDDVIPPAGQRNIKCWVYYLETTFGKP